ncbi:MAG: hypothetical protein M4579_006922 [Chaenotheca gracillima]|nr:MAG: hypothetical protein M4579_006922 [Chaenotheca gracillima]
MTSPYVGQRLSFSGSLCTVRYVGAVEGNEGTWLGVEWDDPARGKHSGEHNGVRYFECKSEHSTAGSFIRPSRRVDAPHSFLGALRQKYGGHEGGSEELTKAIEWGGKVVEEVGFEKIRRQLAMFQELRNVILDGSCIAGLFGEIGDSDGERRRTEQRSIAVTCPKVVELDMSRNLLERWEDVVNITQPLEDLEVLKMNGNRFSSLALGEFTKSESTNSLYSRTLELGLDVTFLSWDEITHLAAPFTRLTALSASFNNISTITAQLPGQTLTKLTLEGNRIPSIANLAPLARMQNLAKLSLRDNRIRGMRPTTEAGATGENLRFPRSLGYIDLSYNAIGSWLFIEELQEVFPGLAELRVAHNPLYDEPTDGKILSDDEGYMLTVARLKQLKRLNFSPITTMERAQSEMYHLSRIANELANAPADHEAQIVARHPRYHELCELYGPPTIRRAGPSAIDPNSLGARLITFTFTFTPPLESPAGRKGEAVTCTKRIPRGFDVYRLKGIVGRLLGLRPFGTRLIWETGEWDPVGGDEEDLSDSDSDSNSDDVDREPGTPPKRERSQDQWVRREVELEDGTRGVGFWIEGSEAKVRVELR